jgi:hypothetical protein
MKQVCCLFETQIGSSRQLKAIWGRWPSEEGLSFRMRELRCHPSQTQLHLLLAGHTVSYHSRHYKLEMFDVSDT